MLLKKGYGKGFRALLSQFNEYVLTLNLEDIKKRTLLEQLLGSEDRNEVLKALGDPE